MHRVVRAPHFFAMLKSLSLHNVGPSARMKLDPVAPRFNLITGDNGLGKSFLLDVAWWALTRTWHETPAAPTQPDASIGYSFDGFSTLHKSTSQWNPKAQDWKRKAGIPANPGLVLYARIDGSFSAWDPARNYRLYQRKDGGQAESPAAYQFSSSQVFEGLRRTVTEGGAPREEVVCRGLIDDWTRWQATSSPEFELLCHLLEHLGPDEQPLRPGKPVRVSLDDTREIPTVQMPYGQEVPLTYCPAGVRRMCKLAYLLAWTLAAHEEESKRIGRDLARQVIVLIDEPETHLHPRWQRTVLPGLYIAIANWNPTHNFETQFLLATHSPLVLASIEPFFDPQRDALWKLDLVGQDVRLARDEWHKRGDVNRWLVSDVFDLGTATSTEAQRVLEEASVLLAQKSPDAEQVRKVDVELGQVLPEMDPFFIRWRYYMKSSLPNEGT